MAYSRELRERVLRFIEEGGSKVAASRLFDVSRATVFLWVQQGEEFTVGKPGPRSNRKLDCNQLVCLLEARPDMMLKELAQTLGVGISTVSYSLKKLGYSRKKNGTLQREKAL